MLYFDKNGTQIEAGMTIQMIDGSRELVYETTCPDGTSDLGISASNEQYLVRHPDTPREFYPLRNYNASELVVVRTRE